MLTNTRFIHSLSLLLLCFFTPINSFSWFQKVALSIIEEEINTVRASNKKLLNEKAKLLLENEALYKKLASKTSLLTDNRIAVATSVIVGYMGCNYILMTLNTKLLHPHLWSFWMNQFSIEDIQQFSYTLAPKFISDIVMRYNKNDTLIFNTCSDEQKYELCIQYISTFFIDIDREIALLTLYQNITTILSKIPASTYLFCLEPVIIDTIQSRIKRLVFYKQLCLQLLQKPINQEVPETIKGA